MNKEQIDDIEYVRKNLMKGLKTPPTKDKVKTKTKKMKLIKLLWCKIVGHKVTTEVPWNHIDDWESPNYRENDGSIEYYDICKKCGCEVNNIILYDCDDVPPDALRSTYVKINQKKKMSKEIKDMTTEEINSERDELMPMVMMLKDISIVEHDGMNYFDIAKRHHELCQESMLRELLKTKPKQR